MTMSCVRCHQYMREIQRYSITAPDGIGLAINLPQPPRTR